jgi:hypothetical protein
MLDHGGEIDVDYWALKLQCAPEAVRAALDLLVADEVLTSERKWTCPECGADNSQTRGECVDCRRERSSTAVESMHYYRPPKDPARDPAAVFLIHGMNTLGDWQQSFAWKLQLLYGYSIPVFVFKFGVDRFSPLTRTAQRRRRDELGKALREAQADLQRSGRSNRCDVIAHSFGTLLFTQLLESDAFRHFEFGRVVLTGSIAAQDFSWTNAIARGRVEAVLNHRGGRDVWVRRAPWLFPDVGSSGRDGFDDPSKVHDLLSPSFEHSDYFTRRHFDSVIRLKWAPFLEGRSSKFSRGATMDANRLLPSWMRRRRFWVGRMLIAVLFFVVALAVVRTIW